MASNQGLRYTDGSVCPICGKPIPKEIERRFLPFCSERCKLIDLGAWVDEKYRVPTTQVPDLPDESEGEVQ